MGAPSGQCASSGASNTRSRIRQACANSLTYVLSLMVLFLSRRFPRGLSTASNTPDDMRRPLALSRLAFVPRPPTINFELDEISCRVLSYVLICHQIAFTCEMKSIERDLIFVRAALGPSVDVTRLTPPFARQVDWVLGKGQRNSCSCVQRSVSFLTLKQQRITLSYLLVLFRFREGSRGSVDMTCVRQSRRMS